MPVKPTGQKPKTPTSHPTRPQPPTTPSKPAANTHRARGADGLDTRPVAKQTWAGFTGDGNVDARIQGLSSPMMNSAGRVVFPWDKKGDAIPFELTVEVNGDRSKVKAELWTNANHNDAPNQYDALPMREVRAEGNRVTYRVEVPIDKIGNYRATARISTDGGLAWSWAGQSGIGDIRFRPHVEAHDALNMMEVNILNVNGGRGTLTDMMGSGSPQTDGKYTLEYLSKQGVNAIWVMPPFKKSQWEYRHPLDDAGSPYAAKDYFAVDPDLSKRAQQLEAAGKSDEEVEQAATEEWKQFVAKAHSLGIKVVVDVALNHVGHNYEFSDLFKRYDAAGREVREVRHNDFSQVVVNPEQAKVVADRLADPNLPKYMEYIAPWMYASQSNDPAGAKSVHDAMAGGGQWHDTKQLYTGGSYGPKNPQQNDAVVGYLGRVLEYWSVDMGVDGFRLDHLTGLPQAVMEQSLNLAQAAVDRKRPGTQLYVTGEDFFSAEYNSAHLDNIQDTWLRNALLASPSADTLRNLFTSPYFLNREMINLTSHDEHRFDFHGDTRAAARLESLLPLLGGTTVKVAGDELGEHNQLAFKQYRPVEAIEHPSEAGRAIAEQVRRAGVARAQVDALQDDNRAFLNPRVGGHDSELLAFTRNTDPGKDGNPVVVFANFNNGRVRENAFNLDGETLRRLDPGKRYQIRDLMADDPKRAIWDAPLTGRELMDKGIFARLEPYQVQALEVYEVR